MAHFTIYDTEAAPPAGDFGTEGESPFKAVKAKEVLTLMATQTDFAEYISGSAFAEKEGTLEVQASFDYNPYASPEENEAKSHWAAIENGKEGEGGKIVVKAAETKTFLLFAIAPYFRLVWTQGEAESKKLRLFARAQEKGRI